MRSIMPTVIPQLTFDQLAAKYCERQQSTPEELRCSLLNVKHRYNPDGFMLLECHMLDSLNIGNLTILAYGPHNTYKEPPTYPISPRGLASDMSMVVGTLSADQI